jgi:hypothetical protein
VNDGDGLIIATDYPSTLPSSWTDDGSVISVNMTYDTGPWPEQPAVDEADYGECALTYTFSRPVLLTNDLSLNLSTNMTYDQAPRTEQPAVPDAYQYPAVDPLALNRDHYFDPRENVYLPELGIWSHSLIRRPICAAEVTPAIEADEPLIVAVRSEEQGRGSGQVE